MANPADPVTWKYVMKGTEKAVVAGGTAIGAVIGGTWAYLNRYDVKDLKEYRKLVEDKVDESVKLLSVRNTMVIDSIKKDEEKWVEGQLKKLITDTNITIDEIERLLSVKGIEVQNEKYKLEKQLEQLENQLKQFAELDRKLDVLT